MTNQTVIIVQGPIDLNSLNDIKKSWSGYDIIYSTWNDVDKNIFEEDDTVIFNDYPSNNQPKNWPLQRISTLNGLKHAKNMGFKRALKWRSDFQTNNGDGIMSLFNPNYLNFYAYMDHEGGYLTDFFIEGDIIDLINIFDTEESGLFPERILTNRIINLGLDKKCSFICKKLTDDKNVFWTKLNYWFTDNNNKKEYLDTII